MMVTIPVQLRDVLIHRWLISAVAAVMVPQGFFGRGILTLQGPQSIGKTSWIRELVPDPHSEGASDQAGSSGRR